MTSQEDPRQEAYEQAREAFERLELPDRFSFLVKETARTIACDVDLLDRAVEEEFYPVFSAREQAAKSEDA